MTQNPTAGRYTCFNLAIVILVLLFIFSLGLLFKVGGEAWQTEQTYKDQRDEFIRQQRLWHSQGISDYEVMYNNCRAAICCENASMTVTDGIIESMRPNCIDQSGLQDYDRMVRTMSEFYDWLEGEFFYASQWERLEIEYHPELHYITRLVWQRYDALPVLEIRYENLQPQDS